MWYSFSMGLLWEMREEHDGAKLFHVYKTVLQYHFFAILPLFLLMAFGESFVPEYVSNIFFWIFGAVVFFNFIELREIFIAQFTGKEIRYVRSPESNLPIFLKPYDYWIEQ
jgi:hypothetical protein